MLAFLKGITFDCICVFKCTKNGISHPEYQSRSCYPITVIQRLTQGSSTNRWNDCYEIFNVSCNHRALSFDNPSDDLTEGDNVAVFWILLIAFRYVQKVDQSLTRGRISTICVRSVCKMKRIYVYASAAKFNIAYVAFKSNIWRRAVNKQP